MLTPAQILFAFAIPALLVIAAVLIPLGRAAPARPGLISLAIAAGFAIAYGYNISPPRAPGLDAKDWLFYATIPLALLAILDALFRPPLWLRATALLLLYRITLRLLLLSQIPRNISPAMAELYIDIISSIGLIWWLTLESLAARTPSPTTPLTLWLIAAGAAATMVPFPSIQNPPLAASLSAMTFAAALGCFFRRNLSFSHGPVAVVSFLLILLLTHAFIYNGPVDHMDRTLLIFLSIMLAAPLLALLGDLPGLRKLSPELLLTLRLLILAAAISTQLPRAITYINQSLGSSQDE